ncbi:MAG: oxygen-independent coproporphyrinogen III oxidase [Gemmatimonadetes bacterium]|jgi:oxygen-independent coproporphyrinogen III oxidase|nr:oxygen-independent coproporphyrinogen III oxidase [Gemmatimonadota bacterium]MBT6144307.1 oxygen-independent coproporphyrinogen III oxidase [Gemmatimonadota bacterium]MBT7858926.1 oxygen-independent coproporphyrinogen III oxidase [Gemmatimonadota bacterium]
MTTASTHPAATVDGELLARYDRPGPRYTSYPTAVEFSDEFTTAHYVRCLNELPADDEISLYVHVPFCEHRCHFCGCHVIATRHGEVAAKYLEYLEKEIALVAAQLEHRPKVVQYHWGGGTPTYLTPEQMRHLQRSVESHFDIQPGAEVAIEVDPRVTTTQHIDTLLELGFNRISMGVQDFDPAVQEAIGRHQTKEEASQLYAYCREKGITSINIDLIYGLPGQTPESFQRTLDAVNELRPDRLAVYSYAHVPWKVGNQKRIDETLLPQRDDKFALLASAIRAFSEAGYDMLGMDHFALPEDELAKALGGRRLHRNFMGYTVQRSPTMLGLGISAIGEASGAYIQNQKKLSTYYADIDAGRLPVERGYATSDDDKLRKHVILELMCNLYLDIADVQSRFGINFAETFATELSELRDGPVQDGFVSITDEAIEVLPRGQLFVRNVCMPFDRYLREKVRNKPTFSRTV